MAERGTFNVSRVYIISCDGAAFLKIGIALNCEKRLDSLQIGCPYEIFIAFQTNAMLTEIARQVEYRAHHLLREYHLRGEWFEIDAETAISAIQKARAYVKNKRGDHSYSPSRKRSVSLGAL